MELHFVFIQIPKKQYLQNFADVATILEWCRTMPPISVANKDFILSPSSQRQLVRSPLQPLRVALSLSWRHPLDLPACPGSCRTPAGPKCCCWWRYPWQISISLNAYRVHRWLKIIPLHYLNQCWLIIMRSSVIHLSQDNLTANAEQNQSLWPTIKPLI